MFYDCKSFNSDLSKWDVRNIKEMDSMFYGCESFNSDLSKWNVKNVISMNYSFWGCGCKLLKKIPSWYEEP